MLYLDPHCGLQRQKAMRTRKLRNSYKLSWSSILVAAREVLPPRDVLPPREVDLPPRLVLESRDVRCVARDDAGGELPGILWRSDEPELAMAASALDEAKWRVSWSTGRSSLQTSQ